MINKEIRNWEFGLRNVIEPDSIKPGSVSASLNFLTKGDHRELRRGSKILGSDAGAGSVTGLFVGTKLDSEATEIPLRSRARKIEYYDAATEEWIENGSNVLPAAADGEDVEFDSYNSQAGAQVFASSRQSSIYKIMIANPGSITDLLSTVYRGFIRIKQSRMFLWNRNAASGSGRKDEQNPYLSYIDTQTYTTVTAEAIADLAAATLAFKAGGSKRTCFGIVLTLTSSGEVFTDNRDGTLTGDAGHTGTINYTTGAITTTVSGAGTVDYQWEDSTNNGLADFSYSGTRVAGQGAFFLQGDGGPLMGIESYGDTEYCMHKRKTYALTLSQTDTAATNLIFRDREGIPNHRAIKATSLGIFYVNAVDPGQPTIKLLTLQSGSTAIDGKVISDEVDLSGYSFDRSFIEEWEDYIIVGCRTVESTVNNRFVLYNKVWKAFDIVDYYGLCAKVYGGALIFGDSLSGNVLTAFSGIDDDDSVIDGFDELNEWDLEYPGTLKKVKNLQIEGNIGPDQVIDVKASVDNGPFVTVGQIMGSGTYVDRSQAVNVGSDTIGHHAVGGNVGVGEGITAYHYFRDISLRLDKFERIKIRFERGIDATDPDAPKEGIGYFSYSLVRFRDVRVKNNRIARKYRN